ncbi:putative major capsid protein [Erwinia phage Fifi44]|uniref:Major capsid protein n=1 Tax=Erwinia phage Fifi44 TaxID=2876597 RepID=A0AAE9C0G5_9CAUD|nr:putative major capsid protein [Erwinia phage Fifi44]QQV88359.1 putative major capsid protein [Erwinia phage pEa_SNUABM_27]UCR74925.1 putative major capsid protein [Erwinia phage Fifi44]UCR80842.1 putative major capsid protein [Erwinia phage Fifi451]
MPKLIKLNDGSEFELDDALVAIQSNASVTLSDDDAVFFQRQLEFIEAQTYDTLYPDLEARDALGVDSTGGAGVQTLTYRSYNHVGKAQVINARATDLPKSNISGKEYSIPVKSVGTAYDYDIDEIASAAVTGLPLEARKAMASTRGYEQYINSAAWYGDDANGFIGFFNNPDVTKATVAAGANSKTGWFDGKTPTEILKDLTTAVSAMYSSTLKIMRPDEVWMPVLHHQYIMNTARSEQSDMTILQFFIANNEFINSKEKVKALNAIKGHGASGADCFVVVCRQVNGLKTFRLREPLALTWQPVQLHGLVYEIPGRGRFAGFQVMYPAAISINSGI